MCEDVKIVKGNINLWGVRGVEEGSAPVRPTPQASPSGVTWASAIRYAGVPPGAVQVVAAASLSKAVPPPIQPKAVAL